MIAPQTFESVRSAFRWDRKLQRYRLASSGQFVRQTAVKRALLRVVDASKDVVGRLGASVAEGSISISEWQVRMAATVKSLQLAAHAAARGGFAALTANDFGRIGSTLRFQYSRLAAFALDIERGRISAPAIEARARLYAASANATFENGRRFGAEVGEMTEERRVLGASEHCEDCVLEALRGWQPLGELREIGDSRCMANCRCSFRFR